jgi:adenylate kinase
MSSNVTPNDSRNRLSRLLILGPPGSGKRTQGVTLAQRLEIPALSTGELFRSMMCYDTPLAARLRDMVAHGSYVDDDTTNAVVDKRLNARECLNGFLVYGYPRTLGQVHHLDHLLSEQRARIDAVLCFEVDDEELVPRLLARGELLGRIDDQADTIRARLALYHEQTEPLVDFYRGRGQLISIDAVGSVKQVTERIDAALDRDDSAWGSSASGAH